MSGPIAGGPVEGVPFYAGAPAPADNGLPGGPVCLDQGFAPLPGGVFVADAVTTAPLIYCNFEYLLWWLRDAQLPPLLTTGTPQSFGILGSGGRIIYGDGPIVGQERSGARFTVGTWFSPCQHWGLDSSFFFLGEKNQTNSFADPGTGVLARPFQLPNGRESSELIAFPGASAGTFTSTSGNYLWGADVNLKKNCWAGCRSRLDWLAGFRYLKFDEDLQLGETFTGLPGGPFAGRSGMITDNFSVQNDFYGGQLGANWELRRGRWSLNLLTKVALGSTHQSVEIAGGQVFVANGVPGMAPGLLTQPTNVGKFSRDTFSVVPEVGLNLGWQATDHLRFFVGYNFLYWSNVLRAGDQIDRVLNVDPNSFPIRQLPTGPARPTVLFRDTDLWAQGINFGVQLSW
jgi:hypothetical protein